MDYYDGHDGSNGRYINGCRCMSCKTAHAAYMRDYNARNPERGRAYAKAYRDAHPIDRALRRHYSAQRRWRLKAAFSLPMTRDQVKAKVAYWGDRCWMCGGPWSGLDHIKPLAKGGAHVLANLRPACHPCNAGKKDRWPLPAKESA